MANVAEGKSDCLDNQREDVESTMTATSGMYTVGHASDSYQYMESATFAAAVHKIRQCDAYFASR